MSNTALVTLRLPISLVERADALLEHLTESEESVQLGRPSRSIVLRLAVKRGLELLEQQAGTKASQPPADKKRRAVKRRGMRG